jgi:hypothetical protein
VPEATPFLTPTSSTTGPWFGSHGTAAQRKRRLTNRLVTAVVVVVGVAFGVARLVFSDGGFHLSDLPFMLIALAILLALVWVSLYASSASTARKVKAAAEARMGADVFATARIDELVDALKKAGLSDGRVPAVMAVTVGSAGLELWGKASRGTPLATVPWASVDHVEPEHVFVSRGRATNDARTALVMLTEAAGGEKLPLPIYGPRALRYADVERGNEILGWFARYTRVTGTDL